MKVCPHCRAHYPTHFYVCPQDGKNLESVSDFSPGTIIREKYEILEQLGRGGMGTVYKARHLVFGEVRALKIVNAELAEKPDFLERFRTEAVVMRRLHHPNAVRIEDTDKTEDNRPFLVMEYIQGENLRQCLEKRGELPVAEALEIASQACSALSAAHKMGILHRDIKPDNILLVDQPNSELLAKVTDFGVAKIKETTAQYGLQEGVSTHTGHVIGTPAYMSPEQAMGKSGAHLDARTDLYSLGIVLYEMLVGSRPFSSDTPMGVLIHHIQTIPKPPDELKPNCMIPGIVSELVMKALEKNPEDRFSSAVEMRTALIAARKISIAAPTVPYGSPTPEPRSSPSTRSTGTPAIESVSISSNALAYKIKRSGWRKLLVPVLGIALILAIITVGGWKFLTPGNQEANPPSPLREAKDLPTDPASSPLSQQQSTQPAAAQPDEHPLPPPASQPSEAELRAQQRQSQLARQLTAAQQAFDQGDYAAAIRSYEEVLTLDPTNQTAKDALDQIRQAKAAEEENARQRQAEDQRRRQIGAHLDRAEQAMTQGDYLTSVSEFEAILRIDENHAVARSGLARARKARAAECAVIRCTE